MSDELPEKATFEDILAKLERLVYYIAGGGGSRSTGGEIEGVILLEREEVAGELFLEMFKVYEHYKTARPGMTTKQLIGVICNSLDNRFKELIYRHLVTHRKAAQYNHSLERDEEDFLECNISVEVVADFAMRAPQDIIESQERVTLTRARLSEQAQVVFDAIVGGHPVVNNHVILAGLRNTGTTRKVAVQPWHIADAVAVDNKVVLACLAEIKLAYEAVCNE